MAAWPHGRKTIFFNFLISEGFYLGFFQDTKGNFIAKRVIREVIRGVMVVIRGVLGGSTSIRDQVRGSTYEGY